MSDLRRRAALLAEVPVIHTARLRLRPLAEGDVEWYLRHFSRPEIVEGTGFPAPADREAARRELHTYALDLFERRGGLRWGLELVREPGLIGSIGFYRWDLGPPARAEIGYDLAREHWGQGLMFEALLAALRVGFETMQLDRVYATVLTDNDRSLRLLERAGFVREAVLPAGGGGRPSPSADEVLMSLPRGVWRILAR